MNKSERKASIMKKRFIIPGGVIVLLAPYAAYAQTTLFTLIAAVRLLIQRTAPVVFSAAILFFLWGLAKYMLKTDDVEGRTAARQIMFWGVITIFVMASLWGFVNLLDRTLGLDTNNIPAYPAL